MSRERKSLVLKKDMPPDLGKGVIQIIKRIDKSHNVRGVLYFQNDMLELCTVPENVSHALSTNLPHLNSAASKAISEIDVLDKLIAYRIVTKTIEIIVASDQEFTACVIHKAKKKHLQLLNIPSDLD